MCETWTDFINNCLHDAPWWLEWWVSYWWAPWMCYGLGLLAAGIEVYHYATLNISKDPPHLRIGWMAGGKQPSKMLRALSDYRVWVFIVALAIGLVIFSFAGWYRWQPQNLLASIGAGSTWELSPAGVSLLKQRILTLLVSSIVWVGISVINVVIIWLDPYGFMKFYLTLSYDGTSYLQAIKFENVSWETVGPETRKKEIRQKVIYVKTDGSEFRLTRPESTTDWMWLFFNENYKTLCGRGYSGPQLPEDCRVWFRADESLKAIGSGLLFCIGTDEKSLSRFLFEC
jgi:hypothetical protein